MNFFTSYFGNLKNTDNARYMHMSIARYTPDFFKTLISEKQNYFNGPALAPSEHLLADYKEGRCSQDVFKTKYITEVFDFITKKQCLSVKDYIERIISIYGDDYDGLIFYCYELPEEFCHRHLLAKLFNIHGYKCEEIKNEQRLTSALF